MAEVFPTNLPPVKNNVKASVSPTTARSAFKSGNLQQRNRFSQNMHEYDVTWEMDQADFNTFKAFHQTNLNQGFEAFSIQLCADQGIQTITARLKDGEYKAKNRGILNWVVSAVLIVESNYGIGEDELNLFLDGAVQDLEALLLVEDALDIFVNQTLPANY